MVNQMFFSHMYPSNPTLDYFVFFLIQLHPLLSLKLLLPTLQTISHEHGVKLFVARLSLLVRGLKQDQLSVIFRATVPSFHNTLDKAERLAMSESFDSAQLWVDKLLVERMKGYTRQWYNSLVGKKYHVRCKNFTNSKIFSWLDYKKKLRITSAGTSIIVVPRIHRTTSNYWNELINWLAVMPGRMRPFDHYFYINQGAEQNFLILDQLCWKLSSIYLPRPLLSLHSGPTYVDISHISGAFQRVDQARLERVKRIPFPHG